MKLAIGLLSIVGITACNSAPSAKAMLADSAGTAPAIVDSLRGKTKLERFSAKAGSVIVRGYTEVGSAQAMYGGFVSVTASEFVDATTNEQSRGILIEVREAGGYEKEHRSFIDYDEIESLIRGILPVG